MPRAAASLPRWVEPIASVRMTQLTRSPSTVQLKTVLAGKLRRYIFERFSDTVLESYPSARPRVNRETVAMKANLYLAVTTPLKLD